MSKADEQWQWVDEDPIEKLLHLSEPTCPESPEPYCPESVEPPAEPPEPPYERATRLEKAGEWEPAALSFRQSLEIDPEHEESMLRLGSCLLHLDGAEEALEWFERSLGAGGNREAALFGKAVALQKLERYDEADSVYQLLLRRNPNAPEPLGNLIALSVAREDMTRVADYSRRLLSVDPESKAALQGLAMLAIRNGDQRAAMDYCTRLVAADPDSFEGWFNLRFAEQRMRAPEQPARSIAHAARSIA